MINSTNLILNYAAFPEVQLNDVPESFLLLGASLVIIQMTVLFVLSVNAFKNTFNQGVKRKFDDKQDDISPPKHVNLVCANTEYRRRKRDGSFTIIPCLFIYDQNHPLGETLVGLCQISPMDYRYPLGLRYFGYIKLYAQITERSETGLYNFEGGSCMLNVTVLAELQRNGSVYSGFVGCAPPLPLHPILTPRNEMVDPFRKGVYLRSITDKAPFISPPFI